MNSPSPHSVPPINQNRNRDDRVAPRWGFGRWLLLVLLVLGAMLFAYLAHTIGYTEAWRAWRVPAANIAFLDLHVITAGAESRALGFDPLLYNPQDPLGRPMNYPRIWQGLAYYGIKRTDTLGLGVVMVLAYLLAVLLCPRRLDWLSGLVIAAGVLSPAAMLGVERGNIDLLMFVLVAVAAWLLPYSRLGAVALLGGAFLLKLYPVFGVAVLLRDKMRTALRWLGAVVVGVGLHVCFFREEIAAIRSATLSEVYYHSYGLPNALRVWGDSLACVEPVVRLLAWSCALLLGVVFVLGLFCAFREGRRLVGLADGPVMGLNRGPDCDAFRAGSCIYVGTYLLGSNFDYRMIFILLVIPQLREWLRSARCWVRVGAGLMLMSAVLALWQAAWEPWCLAFAGPLAGALLGQVVEGLFAASTVCLLIATAPDWLHDLGATHP